MFDSRRLEKSSDAFFRNSFFFFLGGEFLFVFFFLNGLWGGWVVGGDGGVFVEQ